MKSGPLLRAEGLVKRFGGVKALDGATVEVRPGFFTLLAGPNGSGKTTLINVVTGLLQADGGRIIYGGRDITDLPSYERRRLGIFRTFQTPRLAFKLTVLDNVIVGYLQNEKPALGGWEKRERELADRAFQLLKIVGLDHMWDRPAGELSGGQMKLLELARAVMSGAAVLLLDEPAAGLNPSLALDLFKRLRDLAKTGVALLVVEHRLDLAIDFADYAYFMHEGKVVLEGPPDQVFKNPLVAQIYLGE
ncbi:ABC transporter ATP-binding protein [Pyrobaculum aerophilum]|uniref:Branched-chain amino acid transport ATP-binding protein n=2 Tax=Pyrobaculum aerophilum TaxID=13773 RepID=Q8ZVX1_PYRAE|nr:MULTISPECIES: ABC transporter ATP-binding protein [Pyrobaculum]AAL63933.1 branched-chain amino acid transport ATP-binding protein [Pyrobaculum aerophilum str. IM2]MCX8137514.1 ABC transporter ATP-binding protein [Pyrobaculum aerophilum]HII46505.1 ABC transporter ATP-binding protein [Pyrobaculum aerophilum]